MTMNNDIKVCETCKWNGLICNAPQNRYTDLVTGKLSYYSMASLAEHRHSKRSGYIACRVYNFCGEEGRWWKSKFNDKIS